MAFGSNGFLEVSTKPLYNSYKILPLGANIKLNQGKFIWKLTQNQHPVCVHPTN